MKYSIIIVLLILQGCAHSDPWTKQDTWMQIAVTTVLVADAYTTSKIQYDPWLYEGGPIAKRILGDQPSTSSTYQYFAVNAIANYLITRALPAKWRPYWQGWEIVVHSKAVYNNCQLELC